MSDKSNFDSWALVELFGRQRIVGKVTEETIGGASFIRVDVPASDGNAAFTRFYGGAAIYCISPVSEEIARELLKSCRNEPVARYELRQLAEKYDHRPGYSPEDEGGDD